MFKTNGRRPPKWPPSAYSVTRTFPDIAFVAVATSSSASALKMVFLAFRSHTCLSLIALRSSAESIEAVRPSPWSALSYWGNFSCISASFVLFCCAHLDPQAASASRQAIDSSEDILWKKSTLRARLSTACRIVASSLVIFALPWMSLKFCSLTITPSWNTHFNSSPGTPAVNSSKDIGRGVARLPSASYSPRFRRTPSAPRMTGGFPP
mmetsp:Transcript_42182/g.111504  ORF Transcript_42182/g.111504 Transcript_42182/m.111504 type:complete len:209 (+) Transcript_42182:125-751(+)